MNRVMVQPTLFMSRLSCLAMQHAAEMFISESGDLCSDNNPYRWKHTRAKLKWFDSAKIAEITLYTRTLEPHMINQSDWAEGRERRVENQNSPNAAGIPFAFRASAWFLNKSIIDRCGLSWERSSRTLVKQLSNFHSALWINYSAGRNRKSDESGRLKARCLKCSLNNLSKTQSKRFK